MSDPAKTWKDLARDLGVLGLLMAIPVAVHLLIARYPDLATRPQADAFDWPWLAAFAVAGAVGVLALWRTPLTGLWDADKTLDGKLVLPIAAGLGLGLLQAAADAVTGLGGEPAARLFNAAPAAGPLLAPLLAGDALLVSIGYLLFALPLLVWLGWGKALNGRHLDLVFWAGALLAALAEPLVRGGYSGLVGGGGGAIAALAGIIGLNLAQAFFFRHAGFVAAVLVRLAYYGIWLLAWPAVQAMA